MSSGEPVRLTREQVREIDRGSIEDYGLPGIVLMENAARAVVDVAIDMLSDTRSPVVAIICGGGNNGGDGLAVARHLHNRDVNVRVLVATDATKYQGDALTNWHVVHAMGLLRDALSNPAESIVQADLVIDALFGTGLTTAPRETRWIDLMNQFPKRVLAVDLPSGLNCDTGLPMGHCVRATRTVTFVAEKIGFANPASKQYTGEVTVGDIGCPRELIEEVAKMSPR